MSILRDLGVLGCLTAVSPMISLKSVAFFRGGGARSRSGGLPVSAEYTTLSPEHEDYRRAQIAHR
uniref:Uncharacterized protein n=1 Tax=Streptomyces auratus AGR0001 TaxID=1160718 RepID=J1RP70_9ACTN